jgi:hypothetical protein
VSQQGTIGVANASGEYVLPKSLFKNAVEPVIVRG